MAIITMGYSFATVSCQSTRSVSSSRVLFTGVLLLPWCHQVASPGVERSTFQSTFQSSPMVIPVPHYSTGMYIIQVIFTVHGGLEWLERCLLQILHHTSLSDAVGRSWHSYDRVRGSI